MDTSWISLTAVHNILRRTTSGRSEGNAKASKFAHQVEVAKTISEKLWSVPDELELLGGNLDKGGSIAGQQSEPPTAKGDGNCAQDSSTSTQDAQLHYQSFLQKNARAWLRRLQTDTSKKTPSAEQLQCIQAVVDRCIQEARDEQNNVEYRSEPLRLILHGVPGEPLFLLAYHGMCT